MTRTLATILAVLLVAVAGCAGGPAGLDATDAGTPASTDEPTATDEPDATDASTTDEPDASDGAPSDADGGTVDFYVSDEPNAIGDFAHLNVTVTKVGYSRAQTNDSAGNDSGGWIERPIENETVDLTRLVGDRSARIGTHDVPSGKYTKVFIYVSEVNATLTNGESVRVKLPSQKLQLNKPFVVESNSSVQFVFDIAVHEAGKSGKYVLRPVVGESGTDVPIDDVGDDGEDEGEEPDDGDDDQDDGDDEQDDGNESALNATFVGNVTVGENATLQVTENGSAVANATVTVNGETVGTTDADGTLTFVVPDAAELVVKIQAGEAETELSVEFEGGG